MAEEKNTVGNLMHTDSGLNKFAKDLELNTDMSIVPSAPDEVTRTLDTLGSGSRRTGGED